MPRTVPALNESFDEPVSLAVTGDGLTLSRYRPWYLPFPNGWPHVTDPTKAPVSASGAVSWARTEHRTEVVAEPAADASPVTDAAAVKNPRSATNLIARTPLSNP